MIYLGADPGLTGAIAFIDGSFVQIYPIPTVTVKKSRQKLDMQSLKDIVQRVLLPGEDIFCVIERQSTRPEQSAQSGLTTGTNYGVLLGMLFMAGIPYEEVTPQRWKKAMLEGTDKSKGASVLKAQSLFPGVSLLRTPRSRVPDHNMAEALLLAEYARRIYNA